MFIRRIIPLVIQKLPTCKIRKISYYRVVRLASIRTDRREKTRPSPDHGEGRLRVLRSVGPNQTPCTRLGSRVGVIYETFDSLSGSRRIADWCPGIEFTLD